MQAMDRGLQMLITRIIGQGKASQYLASTQEMLEIDIFFRKMNWTGDAKAEAENSGKPEKIIDKIVEGKINKFIKENTLLNQPFVKDPDQTVGQLVEAAGASVVGFDRLEVGDGIEKKVDNFAEEVMAQAQGS